MTLLTARPSASRLLAGPPLSAGTESGRDHVARLGPLPNGATIDPNSISIRDGNRVYQPGGCTNYGCTDRTGLFGVTTTPDGPRG